MGASSVLSVGGFGGERDQNAKPHSCVCVRVTSECVCVCVSVCVVGSTHA